MSKPAKKYSDFQVMIFVVILCFVCGLLLAVVAYGLRTPQKVAKEFDQSKQMLISAKILDHQGYFELEGKLAKFDEAQKILVEDPAAPKATDEQIKEISALRIRPLLTDKAGAVYTLKEKDITLPEYLANNKKKGYANLPLKLFYAILPNTKEAGDIDAEAIAKDLSKAELFVIPVSGFGLWAPVYGYIAIEPNGDTVVGTTWYDHGETPGLGANITESWWQNQFEGKLIFHEQADGKTDFKSAQIGIIVVKGKVKDVYGSAPKSKSAVDGISGATLTGDGVTSAYQDSLTPYRNFLIKLHDLGGKKDDTKAAA